MLQGRHGIVVADKYLGLACGTSKFRGRNFFKGGGCNILYFRVFLMKKLFLLIQNLFSCFKIIGFFNWVIL